MTGSHTPDRPDKAVPQADAAAALTERLAEQLGSRPSVTGVFGEPVTSGGVTVIPVAEFAFGFAGGKGPEAGAPHAGEGGGGVGARARGYIEIKDGTATYKPIRAPWANVAVPLAALLTGTVVPLLVRRLAKRRPR
ncbi:GerW family sporulation protein [Streptomyces monticola]|uniref:GerW family sporulation protein n=1 Tax=Streptomyces monticola TaxID=2666263 RepID=A0ABW2JER7_9ACTN